MWRLAIPSSAFPVARRVPVIRPATDGSGHFHHRGLTVSGLTAQMKASAARSCQAQQRGGQRTADGKDQP
ncbi:hypothetical protein ECZU25_39940 [Escherichia coli]|nr:hypothetical protein ECZU25_39940 [Escherichia coli]